MEMETEMESDGTIKDSRYGLDYTAHLCRVCVRYKTCSPSVFDVRVRQTKGRDNAAGRECDETDEY